MSEFDPRNASAQAVAEPLETGVEPQPDETGDNSAPVETTVDRVARRQREMLARQKRWRRTAAILFAMTCVSTWWAGGGFNGGFRYAIPVMAILVAHELGHYFQALRYKVPASPPFFLPMPFSPIGTMGAVIFQSPGYADRKAMFDIAISGPLAGLVLALPCAWFGVAGLAEFGIDAAKTVFVNPENAGLVFGDPMILQWIYELHFGPLATDEQVMLNPVLFAGWVGIFITALNLLPVGQLDGGHILYTLIGRKAHWVAYAVIASAAGWMIYSHDMAYGIFLLLLLKMGAKHPPTRDDTVPLGATRTVLGWATLAFLIVGFTPQPIMVFEVDEAAPQQAIRQLDTRMANL
jgi:membrane-associated protease RseP (regulator of RpoE activity)